MADFGPPIPPHGPSSSRIMLIGECPGEEETAKLRPLVGLPGYELRKMLTTIGVPLDACFKTNVFSRQPRGNNLALFGTSNRARGLGALGPLTLNPITFLHPDHEWEIHRLHSEIASCAPNVIIALGNTAAWALGLGQGLAGMRGSIHVGNVPGLARPVKIIPTYHPSAILRQWSLRTIVLADLQKAANESRSPNFSYDNTTLWLNPSIEDLVEFGRDHMEVATVAAADIETKRGQITCISFAPCPEHSFVVPFWQEGPSPNYWTDPADELFAWKWVARWMEKPSLVKVFQNGLYDLQYLQRMCRPVNCTEDTMLAHHSLFSELPKGLGFLGATYANVPSWKGMRTFKKEEALKRDE